MSNATNYFATVVVLFALLTQGGSAHAHEPFSNEPASDFLDALASLKTKGPRTPQEIVEQLSFKISSEVPAPEGGWQVYSATPTKKSELRGSRLFFSAHLLSSSKIISISKLDAVCISPRRVQEVMAADHAQEVERVLHPHGPIPSGASELSFYANGAATHWQFSFSTFKGCVYGVLIRTGDLER